MSDVKIKNQIKELVSGNLDNVFKLAKTKIKRSSERHKEILLIEARFKEAKGEKRKGTVSDEFYSQTINKIRADIISLADEIRKEDLVDSFVNKKSVKKYQEGSDDFEKRLKFFGLKRKLKGDKGMEIYQNHYNQFIAEFERTLKKYCEIGELDFKINKVEPGRIIKVQMATIKIIPCADSTKKYLWISFDFDGKKNKKTFSSLGFLQLDYSKEMKLVWVNKENSDVILDNKELSEISIQKVIELIMQEE